MKNLNLFTRLTAYISITSGIIWLGSYITRWGITYQLFEPDGMTLKNFVNNKTLDAIIIIISPTVYLTFISYLILIISFSLFLLSARINIKNNGWLMITCLVVFITLPFEVYLMTFDWQLIQNFTSGNSSQIFNLIIERLENLEGFPLILIVCYLFIPYLLLFKPFTLKKSAIEN